MFEKKKKFLRLVESTLERARNNGYLVGDYVTISKKGFGSKIVKDWMEGISDDYKNAIKAMANSDKKLRIAELDTPVGKGFGLTTGTDVIGKPRFATVYEEIAANLWGNVVVVPVALLMIVKPDGNNITPGDVTYKDEKITGKPIPVKVEGDNITLPTKDTKLPSGSRKDGRDQATKPVEK